MGKIMVVVAVLFAVPLAVSAQDFGVEWLDRVTHERQLERGPLKPHPVEWNVNTGVLAYLDSNVYLFDKGGKTPGDTIIVPFIQGRMEYTEQRFEASADLLVNYKGYLDTNTDPTVNFNDSRDWEERFYGHARYVDARFTIGVDEVLRHESDAISAVFFNRIKRVVSDTLGQATYDITRTVAAEVHADYQVIRYEEVPFSTTSNNDNWRADLSLVYRQANGYDWLVQAGAMPIYYTHSQTSGAPPDVDGYYVRAGFRGDVTERLSIQALAGWITVESDRYLGTQTHENLSTADFSLNLRYQATEEIKFLPDLARTIGFAGGGTGGSAPDPFQTVTRFSAIVEWECIEDFTVRARWQWDHAASVLGLQHEYQSYSLSATYKFSSHVAIDGGVTYRQGSTHGNVVQGLDFNDFIFHLGLVLSF